MWRDYDNLNYTHHNPRLMEYTLIAVSFWWGFVLLFPYGTFHFGNNSGFALMARFAGPQFWGTLATFLSGWLLVGVVMEVIWLRRVMLFLHTIWWFFLTLMIAGSDPFVTGTGTYGILAFMSFYMMISPRAYGEERVVIQRKDKDEE